MSLKYFSIIFLKILRDLAETMDSGSLFQMLKTLLEKNIWYCLVRTLVLISLELLDLVTLFKLRGKGDLVVK